MFCFKCNFVKFNLIKKMIAYRNVRCCLECGENKKNISLLVLKAINGGTIILSKCAACNTKK